MGKDHWTQNSSHGHSYSNYVDCSPNFVFWEPKGGKDPWQCVKNGGWNATNCLTTVKKKSWLLSSATTKHKRQQQSTLWQQSQVF